ncbi:GLPGLI family protein [Empedobacter stercoris]|uniref:GLPGLI family protein n=1 Tax=Empedobacter stercoris TaxID=1628248 RepID=A0ABX1WMY3_9FLAO|nr:GLPGLI family protein [Empedobacter stercoris]NOJ75869.1 GLPGLI family protein [Empedobacter stercoris]
MYIIAPFGAIFFKENMKKLQLLIIIFISSIFINAQEITYSSGTKFSKIDFEKRELEASKTNIIYNYLFVRDVKTQKSIETSTILSIGEKYVKFYDYNRFLYENNLDSINKVKSIYDVNDVNALFLLRRKIKFKSNILGQNKDGILKFTFQDKIYDKEFKYDYGDYKLDWKLTSGTKNIGEYICKEATLNYGGRKWTAYYTEEIPLNYGPYIFNGLPGLILEIFDTKNEHHFLFEGIISNNNISIYVDNNYSNRIINKKDFLKGLRNFNDNPSDFIGNSYSAPNVEETTKAIPWSYYL